MRFRGVVRLAAVGAVAVMLPTVFAGSAAAMRPDGGTETTVSAETAETGNPDADTYAQDVGVSLEEAARRLALQEKVPAFEELVAEQAGSGFGGVWIEHEPELKVIVGLTKRAPRPNALEADQALRDVVEVRTVEHSEQELRTAREAAEAELEETGIAFDSYLDVTKNKAVIQVTELPATLAALDDGAAGPVDVESVDELAESETNFIGGQAGTRCTTGFVVIDEKHSNRRAMTTAGHCPDDQTVTGVVLPFERDYLSGNLDLQINRVALADDLPARVRDGASTSRSIKSTGAASTGSLVCKFGKESGFGCGRVTTTTARLEHVPNSGATFVGVSKDGNKLTKKGDSGGPWYYAHSARGIHSGGNDSTSYYMPVRFFSIADVHVATAE